MTKRHGQLFDDMFTLDALHAAYLLARRRKRKKSAVVSALGHARNTATWRHFVRRIVAERPDIVPSLPLLTRLSFNGAINAPI